ncbi:MAG: signal peptidase I [Ruminococcus sp.]
MLKKIGQIIGIVLLVVFMATLVYVLVARISGQTPHIFGFSVLRVSSESMEPELQVGDIIIVRRVEPDELEKGDVISYRGKKGPVADMLVTHQIVSEPYEKDGVYYFTTRGIREGAVNDPEIDESQVLGKVLIKVPVLGTLYDFFSHWYGFVAFAAILLIAFSGEIINLINIIRHKYDESDDLPQGTNVPEYNPQFAEVLNREAQDVLTNLEDEQ